MRLPGKPTLSLILLTVSILISIKSYASTQGLPIIDKVVVLSGKENSIPTDTNKIIKYNEEIRLYALLKCGKSYYLGYEGSSFPNKVKIKGKAYSIKDGSLKRWKKTKWGSLDISWYKVMPKMAPSHPRGGYKWYSNVFSEEEGEEGEWRGWQIIEYKQIPLKERGWSIKPEKEVGTVRFRAEVIFNGKVVSSPGRPDPTHPSGISAKDYDRGIKDTVHRISRLSNHTNKLIRYIEALRGVPWLWGPAYKDPVKKNPSSHQSDLHNPVGIECSSVLISALRAMGNKNLEYTKTKNLALRKYTHPITDATLTYSRRNFFKNWTPRGVSWSKEGKFYIYGAQKIQIRDKEFNLIEEIKNTSFQFIDIAPFKDGEIYSLVEDNLESKVVVIKKGITKELFAPKITKTITMGEEKYTCKIRINPRGIDVAGSSASTSGEKIIYLLDSDTVYSFNLQGEELEAISLEGAPTQWTFLDSLSVQNELFYIPTQDGKILVYNLEGKLIKTIDLQQSVLYIDVREDKIAALHPFPLRVELYNVDGSFFLDFAGKFLNEKGEEVKIKIGSSPQNLQIGDLMITISPSYHLLIFYEDNGNKLLDSKDKVICAGHEGIEIRRVSYFEKKKFLLRRLNPDIKVK